MGFVTLAAASAWMPFRDAPPIPRSSTLWIERGLAQERAGDLASAQRDLLTAAQFDRQYLPAWTLANFYFRRSSRDAFWPWARRAAAMSYDDLAPLLKLADAMDPGQALAHFDHSPKLAHAYFDLLIGDGRYDDAMAISKAIDDPTRLRAFTTRLIAAGRPADAVEVWKRLKPSEEPTGEGFDWRLPSSPGLSSLFRAGLFDISLDGNQPETIPLLERFLVSNGGTISLVFEYSSDLDGLRWVLDSHEVSHEVSLETTPAWRTFEHSFPARAGSLQRLIFFYRRDLGNPRTPGCVKIRNPHVLLGSGLSY